MTIGMASRPTRSGLRTDPFEHLLQLDRGRVDVRAPAVRHLELNSKHNRPISESLVKTLMADMDAGKWETTHEAIAYDTEANLIDGQHRLHAIARSGKTLWMWVAYNCDPSTFNKVNIGRVRTSADLFAIAYKRKHGDGPAAATYVASIATAMVRGISSSNPTRDETWPFALRHYKLITHVRTALRAPVVNTQVQGAFANAILKFGEDRRPRAKRASLRPRGRKKKTA